MTKANVTTKPSSPSPDAAQTYSSPCSETELSTRNPSHGTYPRPLDENHRGPPEVQVIFEYDLSGVLVNGCNGEDIILLDGTFRTVIVTYADGSTKQRVTTQLKGTGTSGARYVINQTLQDNFDGTAYRGGSVAVLISQGPQVNETLTFRWDGDEFSAVSACQG